jgi:hypothetical protein
MRLSRCFSAGIHGASALAIMNQIIEHKLGLGPLVVV